MNNNVLASPVQFSCWKQLEGSEHKQLGAAAISAVSDCDLNAQAIESCLAQLLARYEILRTSYHCDEFGALWQRIEDTAQGHFSAPDWTDLSEQQIAEQKQLLYTQLSHDPAKGPWLKLVLAKIQGGNWLFLSCPGMNTDATSLNHLVATVIKAGQGQSIDVDEEVIQYAELAPWLSDFLVDDEMVDARAFWTREKSEAALGQLFPLKRYLAGQQNSYRFSRLELGPLSGRIDSFAAAHEACAKEVICAAIRQVLAKYQSGIELSRMFDCRADESLADAIGPLSRAIPIYPNSASDFIEAVKNEVQCSGNGLDFSECFVKEHHHERQGFTFVFDSVEAVQHDAKIEQLAYFSEILKVQFSYVSQGLQSFLQIVFDQSYIDDDTVAKLAEAIEATLLAGIEGKVPQTDAVYIGHGPAFVNQDNTVLTQIDRVLASCDGAIVELDGKTERLADASEAANRLAHYLLEQGLKKGEAVALCIQRSIDFVTAMLAVMRAGGVYVPVDVDLPHKRVASMVNDAGAKWLLCNEDYQVEGCQSINMSALDLNHYHSAAPTITLNADDQAYILFTSGSTGTAKGICISHGALVNHMNWINQEFDFNGQDRFLQRTSASFDASIWEFWSPLMVGATMVIAPKEVNYDFALFKRFMSEQQITRLQIVPSLLDILLEQMEQQNINSLKTLFCGGEALATATAILAQNTFGCEVVNLYGPSECCVDALFWRFNRELTLPRVPIGFAVNNLKSKVVKSDGTACEFGEMGELLIAGDSLFSGYCQRPDLTESALVRCDSDQQVYYKTGDIVQVLADGNLMYLERSDDQVKINGLRIELDEIAMVVLNGKMAQQAKCIYNSYNHALALFYVSAQVDESLMLQALEDALPQYMVPHVFVGLDELPYLPNGKLNQRLLRELATNHTRADYVAPSNEIETKLVLIWQELLDTEVDIGITHDFFAIGGHSLLAMKVLNRVAEEFDVNINVRVLFENKTIAELAAYIEPLTLLADVDANAEEDDDMEGGLL